MPPTASKATGTDTPATKFELAALCAPSRSKCIRLCLPETRLEFRNCHSAPPPMDHAMAICTRRHDLVELSHDRSTGYRVLALSKRIEVMNFDISLTGGPVPFSKI